MPTLDGNAANQLFILQFVAFLRKGNMHVPKFNNQPLAIDGHTTRSRVVANEREGTVPVDREVCEA